ncbi:MAG: YfhO family protein [Polyangiaceae bacterium]
MSTRPSDPSIGASEDTPPSGDPPPPPPNGVEPEPPADEPAPVDPPAVDPRAPAVDPPARPRGSLARRAIAGLRARLPSPRTAAKSTFFWIFFLAIPFAMFVWMIPFFGPKMLGNDYPIWSPNAQLDLMWSVHHQTFPLYIPGFAVGHSQAALTLGQLFHPTAWIAMSMPGYWDGKAHDWNTALHLLSLGIAHALVYKLCRRLSLSRFVSFSATFPAIYNLRMLDALRYNSSIDAYTGMIMLSAACGFAYLDGLTLQSSPGAARAPLLKSRAFIAITSYLLIVSSNPQWAYIGAVAAGCFAVGFPWIARALWKDAPRPSLAGIWGYLKSLAIGIGSGVALATPYLLTFYFEVLKTNHYRAESTYMWTLSYGDTYPGVLANFLMPFHADTHGAFGGSAFVLTAAVFPLAILAGTRPPKVLWYLWGLLLVAFMFATGDRGTDEGAVHHWVVTHVPGFAVFRVPGRIVMMIPALAWPIWAWLLSPPNRRALLAVAIGGLMVWGAKWLWLATGVPPGEYTSPNAILKAKFPKTLDKNVLYSAGLTFLLLAIGGAYKRAARFVLPVGMVFVILSTWLCLKYGTWVQKPVPSRTDKEMTDFRKTSASARDTAGEGMEVRGVTEYTKRKIPTARPIGSILHKAKLLEDEAALWTALTKARETTLFLDKPLAEPGPDTAGRTDEVKLVYNTSNRFDFDVFAAKDGYFLLGVPYIEGFEARVDGVKVPIATANMIYPAIFVSAGAHRVEFKFVSKPFFAGLAIAFLTVWAWIVVGVRRRLRSSWLWRGLILVALLASAAGVYFGFKSWIYGGPSFGTQFTWQKVP